MHPDSPPRTKPNPPVGWPWWARLLYPGATFRLAAAEAVHYLTFDDGPDPGCTPQVLALLQAWGAQATFFCLGQNAAAHPELVRAIAQAGHRLGHHTATHPNLLRMRHWAVVQEVELGRSQVLQAAPPHTSVQWFRPPYGRLRPGSARQLARQYPLALWSHLSGDYLPQLEPGALVQRCLPLQPGAISVWHDRADTAAQLLPALERFLTIGVKAEYAFRALPSHTRT